MAEFIIKTLFSGALLAIEAWVAMLAIGAIHSNVSAVPALGYSTVVLIFVAVGALTGYIWGANKLQDS